MPEPIQKASGAIARVTGSVIVLVLLELRDKYEKKKNKEGTPGALRQRYGNYKDIESAYDGTLATPLLGNSTNNIIKFPLKLVAATGIKTTRGKDSE